MRIRLYAPRKSSAVKNFAPYSRSCNSEMLGSRYLFLTVIALIALKSTHNLSNPSFFLTNRMGDPARDSDFLMNPFARFSVMYLQSTSSSLLDSWYIGPKGGSFPSLSLISQS
jgi:hypothetical protein